MIWSVNNKIECSNLIISTGVPYTYECMPCPAGTFSDNGASFCTPCALNTFSKENATKCTNCDSKTEYAERGSPACKKRPACKQEDYFETFTECDNNKQVRI